jgi:hypothetical protein
MIGRPNVSGAPEAVPTSRNIILREIFLSNRIFCFFHYVLISNER